MNDFEQRWKDENERRQFIHEVALELHDDMKELHILQKLYNSNKLNYLKKYIDGRKQNLNNQFEHLEQLIYNFMGQPDY